jgi:hypothetical protein
MKKKQGKRLAPSAGTGPSRWEVSIPPSDFYSRETEKTKFNWFLFEFASEFLSHLRPLKKRLALKGIPDAAVAQFCVGYAKSLRQPILDRLAGKTAGVMLSYHEIERLLPQIDDRLLDDMLTAAATAWESLLELCVCCPSRCMTEKELLSPMFDDPFYSSGDLQALPAKLP